MNHLIIQSVLTIVISFSPLLHTDHKCPKDNSAGCYASPVAVKEYDGVDGNGQDEPSRVHFNIEHHSGRGGSHASAQIPAADSRKEIGAIYSLGTSEPPSGPFPLQSVCANESSRLGPDACQPHEYLFAVRALPEPIRQAEETRRLLGSVQEGGHVQGRSLGAG